MVERVADRVGGEFPRQIEMGDLSARMYAGVRPAGARDRHAFARKALNRGFQRRLHRGAVVLPLPAGERPAVIFDCQAVARHHPSRRHSVS